MNSSDAQPVRIGEKALRCLVCGHDEFHLVEGIVTVHGATAFGLALGNPSADLAICGSCGHLHTFVRVSHPET